MTGPSSGAWEPGRGPKPVVIVHDVAVDGKSSRCDDREKPPLCRRRLSGSPLIEALIGARGPAVVRSFLMKDQPAAWRE